MEIKVELVDYFSKIEGEEIYGYLANVVDENNTVWRYTHHRQPRQSLEQFIQEVKDAFRFQRDDDFRVQAEEENESSPV